MVNSPILPGNGRRVRSRGPKEIGVTVVLTALLSANAGAAPGPAREGLEFFEKKIRPVLLRHCYECHSGDAAKAKGHFKIDTRDGLRKGGDSGAAIMPGHPDESLLVEAIRYEGLEMPPKEQLPEDVVADIVKWIEMGAPDPRTKAPRGKFNIAEARKWWSFQRPKAADPPETNDTTWPRTIIDRFVLAGLEKAGLRPVADADRVTLIRRATFDVTGLPPTPEEIDAFVQDPSGNAFATVVDRLLESPRYGERWGRHWLDTARYAESTGKERNVVYRYAWRYRNYVIDSFNADKPYDRFIVEQVAGDLLPARKAEEHNNLLIATGFLALGPKGLNERNEEQYTMDVVDDQIDVTMRGILGLTMACARCHDHKFDPIPTTDYYALAGVFHSTETMAGVRPARPKKKEEFTSNKLLLGLTDPSKPVNAAEARKEKARQLERRREEAQLATLRAQMKAFNEAKKKGLAKLPGVKGQGQLLKTQIDQLEKRLEQRDDGPAPTGELAMGVRDAAAPANYHVLNRGDVKEIGPDVPRGGPTVLKTGALIKIRPGESGRLELAHWIVREDNPLTARVMVNRVWQYLFGQGFVETPDNFGALGDAPSNQELLDTLAVQFMTEKWSIKQLIRSIMRSRVYQLSSHHNETNHAKDPSNRLLWRMDRRRLDAEEIRDAILAVSGRLDLNRPEGSPVMEMEGLVGKGKRGKKAEGKPEQSLARSVYLPIIRGNIPPPLAAFDMADPLLIVAKRDVTNVATQALFMMNSPFVLQQSAQFAKRLLANADMKEPARIDLAYRLALGRMPSDKERARIEGFLKDYRQSLEQGGHKDGSRFAAWSAVCQTLLASAEFRYLY